MNRFANQLILYGGLATSACALFVVYLIAKLGFNLMGLYWLFIVPVGAIIVGLISGIGYAVVSKWTNFRASGTYLWFVVGVSLLTYGASHYVTYRQVLSANGLAPNQISFTDYMRLTTESTEMADHDGDNAFTVGKFGYLLLLLEAIGFGGAAAIPLLVVSQAAYCEGCSKYMVKKWEAFHNSEKTTAELKGKKDEKAALIEASMQEVVTKTLGDDKVGESDTAVTVIDAAKLEAWRTEMSPIDNKALARVHVLVKHCEDCGRQHADVKLEFVNVGKEPQSNDLAAAYIDP
jgi:hypothetical protein